MKTNPMVNGGGELPMHLPQWKANGLTLQAFQLRPL